MPSFNFTKASIDALPLPSKNWVYHSDLKTPSLQIGIGATGVKTFVLSKRINGVPERIKLGRYPDMSIEQARKMAMELNGQIATGKNPADAKRERRDEMTLEDLFHLYMKRYAIPHALRTAEAMRENFAVYLGKLDAPRKKHGRERVKPAGAVDWSKKKISTITQKDVANLHHQLGSKTGKVIANRVIELLRAVYNRCIKLRLISSFNPAEGIEPFKEVSRDRYLNEDEIPQLFVGLEHESEQNRDFFLLALLTGARKANVLSIRWQDIDFNLGHWRVSGEKSKNGQAMIIPLTKGAAEILLRRQKTSESEFVFPGTGVKGYMTSPKAAWKRVVTRAGIENIRPHDLRRSLGSWMANTGASMVIIGGALGHKDPQSTKVYARLAVNPIKSAMEIASDAMLKAAKPNTSNIIVSGDNV